MKPILSWCLLLGAFFLSPGLTLRAQDVQVEEFGTQEVWRDQAEAALEKGNWQQAMDLASRACGNSQEPGEQMACRWLAARAGCRLGTKTGWPALETFLRTWPGQFALQPTDPCLTKALRGKYRKKLGSITLPELPEGSTVTLDGVPVTRMGQSLVWPSGAVQLSLKSPGYQGQQWDLDIPARGQGTFEPQWQAVSRPLTLFAKPLGAELFLNGVSVGSAVAIPDDLDPLIPLPRGQGWGFIEVAPRAFAEYRAKLVAPCHLPREMHLRVPPEGAPTPLHLAPIELRYAEAPLNLAGPDNARVLVDGVKVGFIQDALSLCAGPHHLEVIWPEGRFSKVIEVKGDLPLDLDVFPRWDLVYGGILNRVPGAGPVASLEREWEIQLTLGLRWQNLVADRDQVGQQTFLQELLQASVKERKRALLNQRRFDRKSLLVFGESLDGRPNGPGLVHFVHPEGWLETIPLARLNQPGRIFGDLVTARAPLFKAFPGLWRLSHRGWTQMESGNDGVTPPVGSLLLSLGDHSGSLPLDLQNALGALPMTQNNMSCVALLPNQERQDLNLKLTTGLSLLHPENSPGPVLAVMMDIELAQRLNLDDEGRGYLNQGILLFQLGFTKASADYLQLAANKMSSSNSATFLAEQLNGTQSSTQTTSRGKQWLDRPGGFPLPYSPLQNPPETP